jgi:hypothetical protein
MGQPWPPVNRRLVWKHVCYDKPTTGPAPAQLTPMVKSSKP